MYLESLLDNLCEALRQVQRCLSGLNEPWLVGGSCGLMLQGVPLLAAPRDLDVYADSKGAVAIHELLSPYSVDEQLEDQSGIYKSILSHYHICGIKVELVGGFEVTAMGSVYKVEASFLSAYHAIGVSTALADQTEGAAKFPGIKLMPLEHELLFNLLRNRPDRYKAIAEIMRSRQNGLSETMRDLMQRNSLSDQVTEQIKQLLQPKSE